MANQCHPSAAQVRWGLDQMGGKEARPLLGADVTQLPAGPLFLAQMGIARHLSAARPFIITIIKLDLFSLSLSVCV